MAVGTVTVTNQGVIGNLKYATVDIVGTASYTTTGDALDLNAVCGMTTLLFVDVNHVKTTAPTVTFPVWAYDKTAKKLQAFCTAAGATGLTEATAAGNFSTSTISLFVIGRG